MGVSSKYTTNRGKFPRLICRGLCDDRRPRVITGSGLVVEQSPAEQAFTAFVLGWRGIE